MLILVSSALLPLFVQGQGSGLVETNGLSLAAGVVPTSPVRLLHLQGITQTLRVEGLGSAGTTFNVAPTLSSDALLFTSANGDAKRWSGGTSILFGRDASGILAAISFTTFEAPLAFNSGLTRTVNTIKLGGPILATTDIALAGFNFNFSGIGNIGIGSYTGYPVPPSKLVIGGNTKSENGFSSENGSAAAPGFRFFGATNGPNMGMYRNVDTLFFSTKSTARVRIGNQSNGTTEMWVNLKSPYVNSDVFSATSNLTGDYGVNGYNTLTTAATGGGVYGEARSTTTIGVWGGKS